MNADKIYSYLLKLKLNLHIGPNSNYKTLSMVTKKMQTLCLRKSSFIYWKKRPLPPPPPPQQKATWSTTVPIYNQF